MVSKPKKSKPQKREPTKVEIIQTVFGSNAKTAIYLLKNCENKSLDTEAVHTNGNGSKDYGLFQINDIHKAEFERTFKVAFLTGVYKADLNTRFAGILHARRGWQPWLNCSSRLGIL